MLKKNSLPIGFIQRSVDALVILGSWLLSYFIRFETIIPDAQPGLLPLFLKVSPFLVILSLYSFHKEGLYRSLRYRHRYAEISSLLKANGKAFLIFIIFIYFLSLDKISRIALGLYLVQSSFLLIMFRLTIRNCLRYLRRKGYNLRHLILVGDGLQLENYLKEVRAFKDSGIRIAGWFASDGLAKKHDIPELQGNLEEVKKELGPDALVFGMSNQKADDFQKFVQDNYNDVIDLHVIPELPYSFIGYEIKDFAGVPFISLNQPSLGPADIFLKRVFDFFFSALGLLFLSPLLLIIAGLVKLSSKGPILYGQKRMSLDGSEFTMWKFRSMKIDAENQTGAVWAQENDPRRTKIGTFLRSTSLDELPQLFNVLLGQMSLVGPRPERPVFVSQFKNEIPAYMLRHKVKAGITGWAQVNGWRGNTSLQKRIECDIFYIRNWSLWLDFKIIILTLWTGLVNKNAY